MAQYLESIKRFDKRPSEPAIESIVKHLGIALRSSDGSTVATSDPRELERIRDGFCAKHLGLEADKAESLIAEVADEMKQDAAKCRVTFYYLLAHKSGNLEQFV